MHILFIYEDFGILGGIETLIIRMSEWLTQNGHTVSLIIGSGQNWADLLPAPVRCVVMGKRFRELYYYYHARRLWESLNIPKPDVIKSFNIGASWTSCQLAAILRNDCKVIAGLYNPYLFKWYYAPDALQPWWASKLYLHNYLNFIPSSARFFCGVDQIDELEEVYHHKGVLWPIPINPRAFTPGIRKPKYGHIVSIGRLSSMKEYNLYMIDVISCLKSKGYPVTWSVYGSGEYEPQMRDIIRERGLDDSIRLFGTVPYARFWKVLEDAYLFVGMGTSILEASLFKVPNIVAQPYDHEGKTYGPSYRLPRGSITPATSPPPGLRVADEIERLLQLSPEEYGAEEERVFGHVEDHQIESSMNRFLDMVKEAEPIKQRNVLFLSNYLFWFLRRMMNREKCIGHPNVSNLAFPGCV